MHPSSQQSPYTEVHTYFKLLVETTRPAQRVINNVGSVGGA